MSNHYVGKYNQNPMGTKIKRYSESNIIDRVTIGICLAPDWLRG